NLGACRTSRRGSRPSWRIVLSVMPMDGGAGRVLVVATAGAGGDLQPLLGAALGLRDRGHETRFLGDASVGRALRGLRLDVQTLPPEPDLGPTMSGAIREAMQATGGDLAKAGPILLGPMAQWAERVAEPIARVVGELRPDAVVTSLFGVEALKVVSPPCP